MTDIELNEKQLTIVEKLNEALNEAKANGLGFYFDTDTKVVYAFNKAEYPEFSFDGAEYIKGGIENAIIHTYDDED